MRTVNVRIALDEAVMLDETKKRKGFSNEAKLIKFFLSELHKNEELRREFRKFIIDSRIDIDNSITQSYTLVLSDDEYRQLRELADEFALTMKSFLRFLIHFLYNKTTS